MSGDLRPEYGVRYTNPDGGTFDAPAATERGARHILGQATGKGWSHPAVAVVVRDVSEWRPVE